MDLGRSLVSLQIGLASELFVAAVYFAVPHCGRFSSVGLLPPSRFFLDDLSVSQFVNFDVFTFSLAICLECGWTRGRNKQTETRF